MDRTVANSAIRYLERLTQSMAEAGEALSEERGAETEGTGWFLYVYHQ